MSTIELSVHLTPLSSYNGSLSSRVYHSLKDAILSLAYEPGQIMRKHDICEQLDISRSPVSEAVTRLAAEGLVDVVPQAGTFVARFSLAEIRFLPIRQRNAQFDIELYQLPAPGDDGRNKLASSQ